VLFRSIGTVTTVDHHSLVAASIEPLCGTSPAHHSLVASFLSAYYGSDQDTPADEPMHTVTTKPRFALVMVEGVPNVIADIGMRMLQPRELYTAQGFPASYIIDRGADGRPLSKAAQVRMCGNSVSPAMSRALVLANYTERHALREAA
jgi:DNA (cytosine-5)-methyltransferase 1